MTIYKFSSLRLAVAFAARCTKPMRVMFGDCPTFWVVRPADAAKLEKDGYEYAI